jgi:hypothetical protein
MLRRLIFVLILAPNLTGCLAYAYPDLVYTPQQPIENEDGSAHAFRVDIDTTERKPQPSTVQFTLMRIPIDRGGLVPSQLEIAPATGVYDPLKIGSGAEHERNLYTMNVRLYRPGYQTKEVKAWDKTRSPKWAPAPDLLSQEKAIDDLLAVPGSEFSKGTWWEAKEKPSFQPGTVSKSQYESLMFVSSEYQRLASSPAAGSANMIAVRERLQQKAIFLRDYAEPLPAHLTPYRIHGAVGHASPGI